MSFTELLESLEDFTFKQRQQLLSRLAEIDEPPLTPEIERIIEERLAEHKRDPESAIPLKEVLRRLKAKLKKNEPPKIVKQTLDSRWEKFLADPDSALTIDQVKALMAARRKR